LRSSRRETIRTRRGARVVLTLDLVLLVASVVVLLLAAAKVDGGRVGLQPLGLALFVLTFLTP